MSRPQAEQIANALHSGVGVSFGVFRQELADVQRAGGIASHEVGKRAAAINPETPAGGRWLGLCHRTMESIRDLPRATNAFRPKHRALIRCAACLRLHLPSRGSTVE